jgi:hypothetical protein
MTLTGTNPDAFSRRSAPSPERALATLLSHPSVWRADAVARPSTRQPLSTGYPPLDRKLAEKGWPRAGLVELQCPEPGVGELRLLVPALDTLDRESDRLTVWVDPPFIPYAPALTCLGFDLGRMLLIRTDRTEAGHRNALWSAELALKSGACHALLAWLDESRLEPKHVRRLKLAARQSGALGVLFRPPGQTATMADLKISLASDRRAERLELTVLKQRGGWPTGGVTLTLADRHCSESLAQMFARWRAIRCLPETRTDEHLDTWFAAISHRSDAEIASIARAESSVLAPFPIRQENDSFAHEGELE